MFFHIFKYRLKSFFRDKEEFFWCLLFPLLLFLCFKVAFSAITDKAWTFHSIPVAVVYEQDNEILEEVLDAIGKDNSQGEAFLKITTTDYASAKELLNDKKIDGIIVADENIKLVVGQTGLNQTALHNFINMYLQQMTAVKNVATDNPQMTEALIEAMTEEITFIKKESLTENRMDPMEAFYFSLIAFAALSGGYYGIRCAMQQKADSTKEGLRKSISGVKRGHLLLSELCATYLLNFIIISVIIAFIFFVLKLDFGGKMGYVILICAAGSFTGVSNGLLVGSIPKIKPALQTVIYVAYTLLSAFLSGLMVMDIKLVLEHNAPIVNRLNPATLIQDSLYALAMYDTYDRFFTNLITLLIWGIVSLIAAILFTRRERYASL